MMKKVLFIGMVMCGFTLSVYAHKTYCAGGWQQTVVLGEFIPVELDEVPMSVLNAVDNAYEQSEIEAVAKEVNENGMIVYQFTLASADGVLYNVFFTDRGIELK